ncbi:hypothetical protein [Salinicoccus sp. HZC-1]|uniref:hypothetical protein n=1 Tax=Salinicoccus sp. HZC-1 TaxID=3385497 RepID=UPI00398A7B44
MIIYKKCLDCGSRETEELKVDEYSCVECGSKWTKEEAFEAAYDDINVMKVSYGGFFGGYNEIDIDIENSEVSLGFTRGKVETTVRELNKKEITELMNMLKEVDILNWKRSYDNPYVLDGTQWDITLQREAGDLVRSGNNEFPKGWDKFGSGIEKIAQASIFQY